MKIILVLTDTKKRSLVFITNKFDTFSLKEAVQLARNGQIEKVHVAHRKNWPHLRTNREVPERQELDSLSLSSFQLFFSINNLNSKLFKPLVDYLVRYQGTLNSSNQNIIRIGGFKMVTKNKVKEKLRLHKKLIFEAAKHFNIDPYLLGAIIIDEIARLTPFEVMVELLVAQHVGRNTSLGIAQIKVGTARELIKKGYYNLELDNSLIDSIAQPKHNIFLAAARIRFLIDRWSAVLDISNRPEIVATLYSLEDSKKKPHSNPQPNERGNQIVSEFYKLSKLFLG